jgi:hypothetical protein
VSSHPFATIGERETIPPTSHLEISLCDGWLPLIFQLVCCGARLNSRAPAFIPTNIKDTDMKSRFCRTPHDRHRASCSAGHRRPRAQLGPWAVRGLRWSCTALYEAAPSAVGPTGTTGRGLAAEASRRRMRISAPPAARPFLGSRAARGPEELLDPERETTRRRMRI